MPSRQPPERGLIQSSAQGKLLPQTWRACGWTYDELDRDSGHQRAEENDTDRLDPRPALYSCQAPRCRPCYIRTGTAYDRILVDTWSRGKSRCNKHHERRHKVHLPWSIQKPTYTQMEGH